MDYFGDCGFGGVYLRGVYPRQQQIIASGEIIAETTTINYYFVGDGKPVESREALDSTGRCVVPLHRCGA